MNWAQFKKNIGLRVQLEPTACILNELGGEVPEENDDWIVQNISADEVVSLRNTRTNHVAELGKDHIYDFRSNPGRSKDGYKYGFVVLKVQVFLQGTKLWIRPNSRPGEHVSPQRTPQTQPEPSKAMLHLMADLASSSGWAGTPAEFNGHAARVLYGADFGSLLSDPPDYFSALVVNGYVCITGLTDNGNRPDGKPDTTITIDLSPLGKEALAKCSPKLPLNTDG